LHISTLSPCLVVSCKREIYVPRSSYVVAGTYIIIITKVDNVTSINFHSFFYIFLSIFSFSNNTLDPLLKTLIPIVTTSSMFTYASTLLFFTLCQLRNNCWSPSDERNWVCVMIIVVQWNRFTTRNILINIRKACIKKRDIIFKYPI